jgi:hypothetical protein
MKSAHRIGEIRRGVSAKLLDDIGVRSRNVSANAKADFPKYGHDAPCSWLRALTLAMLGSTIMPNELA